MDSGNIFYKVFTSDYRSPLHYPAPRYWNGNLPCVLPELKVDWKKDLPSQGWHFTDDLAAGLAEAGLWHRSYSTIPVVVEPVGAYHFLGPNKLLGTQLKVLRFATEAEIEAAVRKMLTTTYKDHISLSARMEVIQRWRYVMTRPKRHLSYVETTLNGMKDLFSTTANADEVKQVKDMKELNSVMKEEIQPEEHLQIFSIAGVKHHAFSLLELFDGYTSASCDSGVFRLEFPPVHTAEPNVNLYIPEKNDDDQCLLRYSTQRLVIRAVRREIQQAEQPDRWQPRYLRKLATAFEFGLEALAVSNKRKTVFWCMA